VVSNAGAGWLGFFEQMPPAEIDALLDINLRPPCTWPTPPPPTSEKALPEASSCSSGSIAGLVGVAEEVAYSTAKAGLQGLADSLRAEWTSDQVTVTLVSPGPVDTPFYLRRNRPYTHSWPRPIPAATVAKAIVRAIETRREDVVIPAWLALAARPPRWLALAVPGAGRRAWQARIAEACSNVGSAGGGGPGRARKVVEDA